MWASRASSGSYAGEWTEPPVTRTPLSSPHSDVMSGNTWTQLSNSHLCDIDKNVLHQNPKFLRILSPL